MSSLVVAIVGAESTGKTVLAATLRDLLAAEGLRAAAVPEELREFCDRERRTPLRHEQLTILRAQSRRIAAAALSHDVVLADTTALMTAVYSEMVFGDRSLYAEALLAHAACDLTLLTALDLPWQADGLQRDGAHAREPVDALLRAALHGASLPFSVIAGRGDARAQSALRVIAHARRRVVEAPLRRWHVLCERCGDPTCERALLPSTPCRAEAASVQGR